MLYETAPTGFLFGPRAAFRAFCARIPGQPFRVTQLMALLRRFTAADVGDEAGRRGRDDAS